jgi:hypothetical protein
MAGTGTSAWLAAGSLPVFCDASSGSETAAEGSGCVVAIALGILQKGDQKLDSGIGGIS